MFVIKEVKVRNILDSCGNPTVEMDLITEDGIMVLNPSVKDMDVCVNRLPWMRAVSAA